MRPILLGMLAVVLGLVGFAVATAGRKGSWTAPVVTAPELGIRQEPDPSTDAPASARERLATPQPVAEAPAIAVRPEPPSDDDEESFKWLRETTDRGALQAEYDELASKLNAIVFPAATERMAEGEYEVIQTSPEGAIPMDSRRRHLVEVLTNDPEGRPIRVVLPEAKYPEAYRLRRKITWLDDLMRASQ